MCQVLIKLLPLIWVLGRVSLCTDPIRKRVLVFYGPLFLPEVSPIFFSKLDVMGAHLPSAGPQGRGWVASVGLEPLAPQGEPPSCL